MKYNNCHCGSWKNEKYTYCYVCNIVNQIDRLIIDIHKKFPYGCCNERIIDYESGDGEIERLEIMGIKYLLKKQEYFGQCIERELHKYKYMV